VLPSNSIESYKKYILGMTKEGWIPVGNPFLIDYSGVLMYQAFIKEKWSECE
jgi:hypothetical protein